MPWNPSWAWNPWLNEAWSSNSDEQIRNYDTQTIHNTDVIWLHWDATKAKEVVEILEKRSDLLSSHRELYKVSLKLLVAKESVKETLEIYKTKLEVIIKEEEEEEKKLKEKS